LLMIGGGILGSIGSSLLFGNSTGTQVGSTIGGIAGNLIPVPVLGPLIGSLLGGAIGSLFAGPTPDFAAGGGVNFATFAAENQFKKCEAKPEARAQLLQAAYEIGLLSAERTGTTVTNYGVAIQVGSRDGTRIISASGGDVTTAPGDAEAAIDEIVRQLAASLTGGNDAFVSLTKALADAKVDVDSIVDVLGTLSAITESSRVPVSKYGEAIKKLDEALGKAAASANNSAEAEAALAKARADAIEVLKGQFEQDVREALEQIKDPVLAGFRELARNLASTLNDAKALGVDVGPESDVIELLGLQIEQFFAEAVSGGASLSELTTRLGELGDILKELGIDASVAATALNAAIAAQRLSFNEQVQADIGRFLDGPLDQLERLLEAQKDRLEQAEALGADLSQVERLTALELRQFFQSLSDSALEEVRDFLGLFEEASDAVARNLDLSRQDLRAKADAFGQFAQEFAGLATDFRERFVAASPRESLDILRGRANDLLGQIGQGNESAAQALPQVLNQLVESARQSFGNTRGFQEVLDFALAALGQAETAALDVKTEAERQIAALDESNDLLSEIRDILSSTAAFNALLNSAANGGVASSAELLALIQNGAGLTPSSANDNAATLSITGLIAQSIGPIIAPLASSIDTFTQRLSDMPNLQVRTIEAIDRSASNIVLALEAVENRLDRIEVLEKQELKELERINRAA